MKYISYEQRLIGQIGWFIRLRWIAALGVFLTVLFADKMLHIQLLRVNLYAISAIIAGYNLLFFLYNKKLASKKYDRRLLKETNCFANFQISTDLVCLTLLLHFTGGVENPFAFYFIFHVILASILLSRRASFLQATLAVVLYGGLLGLEYYRLIPHIDIFKIGLYRNTNFIMAIFFAFTTTLYILAYMATSISNERRRGEKRLAALNHCFLGFRVEPSVNIKNLVAVCGELLGATCALYNRLKEGALYSAGQWNTPADYNPLDKPDGHICYDVIKHGGEDIFIVRNLLQTAYAQTDPNVSRYQLQTYIGQAVQCGGDYIGSMCVVYQKDFSPSREDREFIGIIASAIGIEEERQRAKEKLDILAKFPSENPYPVLRIARDGRVLYANAASRPLLDEWGCDTGKCIPLDLDQLMKDVLSSELNKEFEIRHKGRVFSFTITPISDAEYVYLYGMDITERQRAEQELKKAYEKLKETQQELIQAEKMVSLGQLSAGVAHEIKNPLAIILQGIEYLESLSSSDTSMTDITERIKKATLRADRIVKDLLNFSRQTTPEFEELNIVPIIEETLSLVEHQLALKNVKIARELVPDLPKVKGDGNQLKQVFINILINAIDAMPEGGTITIGTEQIEAQNKKNYLQITFTDTGCGIPEEEVQKIFEPFFSTKRKTGGVGLGLSVTQGIIERHNGSIRIKSREGKGTSVIIRLPVV